MNITTANMINEATQNTLMVERIKARILGGGSLNEADAPEDPFGFGAKIGETGNGHDIHHHGHENYSGVVAGTGGIANMDHFTTSDHQDAAKRHTMVAGMAQEHAAMFRRMYGDDGSKLPDQSHKKEFDATMKQMDAMHANHTKIAAAHSAAAG
jgi:hypothetical protein